MKVVVASAFEASSLKAHAINTVKIAEGFARLGHETHVVCLSPKPAPSNETLARLYGLSSSIRWHLLPNRLMGRKVGQHWSFCALALPRILQLSPDLVYSRNYIVPAMTSRIGIPTIGETHAWPDNLTRPFRAFLKSTHHRAFRRCITISQRLADAYIQRGAASDKLMILPDAVDLRLFTRSASLSETPSPFVSPGPHIVYAGHLYDYKGIPTILQAAALLPDISFHLVGGLPQDIERHRQTLRAQNLHNVTLHGLKPHAEVPAFLWHADALLLPPSGDHPSAAWTSPVKLGEYLASGAPVIATRIPALADWLSEDEACFIPPDDPPAMADAIRRMLSDKALARHLATNGLRMAETLTYEARVSRMLAGCFEPHTTEVAS